MQRFGLEGGAVGRDETPVGDLASEQGDRTKRREVAEEAWVIRLDGLREDEPNAIVCRLLEAVAKHEGDLVADVDCEPGKHGAHLRLERG